MIKFQKNRLMQKFTKKINLRINEIKIINGYDARTSRALCGMRRETSPLIRPCAKFSLLLLKTTLRSMCAPSLPTVFARFSLYCSLHGNSDIFGKVKEQRKIKFFAIFFLKNSDSFPHSFFQNVLKR